MSTPSSPSALQQLQAKAAEATAAKKAAETKAIDSATDEGLRIFFGELPPAISYLTGLGTVVYFYQGFHVTGNQEVIDYLATLKHIRDVTGEVKLSDVPQQESRTRSRNWASASKTEMTPADLLARIVAGSGAANSKTVAENSQQSG